MAKKPTTRQQIEAGTLIPHTPYQRRIARAIELGLSTSQARGHAKPNEENISTLKQKAKNLGVTLKDFILRKRQTPDSIRIPKPPKGWHNRGFDSAEAASRFIRNLSSDNDVFVMVLVTVPAGVIGTDFPSVDFDEDTGIVRFDGPTERRWLTIVRTHRQHSFPDLPTKKELAFDKSVIEVHQWVVTWHKP